MELPIFIALFTLWQKFRRWTGYISNNGQYREMWNSCFCITNGFWGLALWDESLFNTLLVTLSLRHCPLLTWERWYCLTILALSTILSGFSLNLILLPSHNFGSSDAQCWTTRLWFLCGMLHLPRVPVCTNEWKKKPVISALVIGGFINIFSRRTTGFHRQANLVELNFFTKNTSLEMVTSGSQNHPHSQPIDSWRYLKFNAIQQASDVDCKKSKPPSPLEKLSYLGPTTKEKTVLFMPFWVHFVLSFIVFFSSF